MKTNPMYKSNWSPLFQPFLKHVAGSVCIVGPIPFKESHQWHCIEVDEATAHETLQEAIEAYHQGNWSNWQRTRLGDFAAAG